MEYVEIEAVDIGIDEMMQNGPKSSGPETKNSECYVVFAEEVSQLRNGTTQHRLEETE